MTHPDVLRRGGIDPDEYSSFAFGIGIERLPMLKYGIDDITVVLRERPEVFKTVLTNDSKLILN